MADILVQFVSPLKNPSSLYCPSPSTVGEYNLYAVELFERNELLAVVTLEHCLKVYLDGELIHVQRILNIQFGTCSTSKSART